MAIVKIQSKVKKAAPVVEKPVVAEEEFIEAPVEEIGDDKSETQPKKRPCPYCSSKEEPHYFDAAALRRFMNDRGRIVGRARTSVCSKHQRRVTKELKRARHLALLPFTVKI